MADRATIIVPTDEAIAVELAFPHQFEFQPDWTKDPPDWTTVAFAPNKPLAIANLEATRPLLIEVTDELHLTAPELARAIEIGLDLYPDVAIYLVSRD